MSITIIICEVETMKEPLVITMAREYASGGSEIAQKVADLLGIPLYNKELITIAAKKSGLTEEAIAARIAGRSRPSRQPKQRDGKISLLIDIQNNIKAQQSAGFTHWAKLNNLKQAAKTMNFLTEHGISSYGELESKLNAVSARRDTAHAEIKRIESRSAELAIVMKHAGTYRQLKPLYDRYRKSNDKEKFLRGHEGEIILFEAAARELKRMGAVPLPTTESMKTELANLNAEKERLLAEYKAARTEAQEYDTVKQNVDALLAVPREQKQQRRHELE